MKFSGHRLDILRRAIGSKATHDPDFEFDSKKGLYKETVILNKNWVVKMFKPQPFDYLRELGFIPGSVEWAKKVKEIVETHVSYMRERLGDIYDKPRVFLGKARTEKGRIVNVVYKAQRNREKDILHNPLESNPNAIQGDLKMWYELAREPENQKLREDFKKLFMEWKKLRGHGLSFDIYPNANMTITRDEESNELRLKIYDAIPLFLIDSLKYHEAQTKDLPIPNDLISLGRKHWGTGYNYSEIFYHELKEHFEEE